MEIRRLAARQLDKATPAPISSKRSVGRALGADREQNEEKPVSRSWRAAGLRELDRERNL